MIEDIRRKVEENKVEFSKHATDQSAIRMIKIKEFREAIANGQIIESYPNDKYGPSCLICGFTKSKRPIHVQSSYPSRPMLKIITLYEPDIKRWKNNFTQRIISNDT